MGTYVCEKTETIHTLNPPALVTLWLVLATEEAIHPSEALKWPEEGISGAGRTTWDRRERSVETQALDSIKVRNVNDFQPGTSPPIF